MKNLISTILFFSFPSFLFSGVPDKKLHEKCLYPTVHIHIPDSEIGGTGVIVKSVKKGNEWYNAVITATHVLDTDINHTVYVKVPIYENWSTFVKYEKYVSIRYMGSTADDIAILLFISDKQMPVAELQFNSKLYIGNDVKRIGCGLFESPRLDYGKITSTYQKFPALPKSNGLIRCSIYSLPGDSGGPVFEENKVVGIMNAVRGKRIKPTLVMPYGGISYFTPVDKLKKFNEIVNNSVDFLWDEEAPMPVMPFVVMKLSSLERIK